LADSTPSEAIGAGLRRRSRDDDGAILVVDDDDDFRELLVEHLVAAGHHVRAAADGEQALRVLDGGAAAVRLVLLDLRMPVIDGFEVCRRAAASRTLASIPIVVMTAEHETRDVASAPNVIAVLHKPLDLRRLDALAATRLHP
jgi:two-component system sensor histidine kinase/response regulator